jgi:hypothetical protein
MIVLLQLVDGRVFALPWLSDLDEDDCETQQEFHQDVVEVEARFEYQWVEFPPPH